jgi:hypothetical protein
MYITALIEEIINIQLRKFHFNLDTYFIYIYTVPTEPNLTPERSLSELRDRYLGSLWVRSEFAFTLGSPWGLHWVRSGSSMGSLSGCALRIHA